MPGFALQKNVSPLQGYIFVMPSHGALPRAITFRPFRALISSFPRKRESKRAREGALSGL
ncbi:MAG: hypothetical protein ACR2P4_08305 [Gammaproteobacteria bacterium]